MDESKTNTDWHRLELDVARLFSAAPLRWDNGSQEELYAGRSSEKHRLMEAVRDPAKHILLYGERGIGKTSISNNFWGDYKTNKFIIVVHVQAYPSDNFSSLWLRALEELTIVVNFYCKENIRSDYGHVSPDILRREFKKLGNNLIPIIIIDEFDQLRAEDARELTANLLKSLHDNGINVTILLIGVADNVEELIANHQSLRRVLSLVKLERMSAPELNEILDKRLQLTPLSLAEDARSAIVGLSCGLPYYVQTLGKFAAQNALQNYRTQVLLEDVNAAIDKFIVESGESFSDAYQRATESRQAGNIFEQMLLASALAVSDTNGFFKPSEVAKVLNLMIAGEARGHSQVKHYLALLASDRRGGVLVRQRSGFNYRYRFSDATIQPFIIMRAIKDRRIDEGILSLLFRRDKDEVGKGGYQFGTAAAYAAQGEALVHEERGPQRISTDPAERKPIPWFFR
jgi:Cdc6-like AAA superfamily ATPase